MVYAEVPPEKNAEAKGLYQDALSYVDEQLAAVIAGLKQSGRWEHTVVVLTSDHGEAFGEHGYSTHANDLHEEQLRIPLLLRAPGLPAGRLERPGQLIDIPPTLLHLVGLPPHPAFQGYDLLANPPATRSLFFVVHSPIGHAYAVRRGTEKLIFDQDTGATWLYDLSTDPLERHDLSAARPERARALRARLDSWRAIQLGYFANLVQQGLTYPPVLVDP
jgi:arylsulfatase A-like enzyme